MSIPLPYWYWCGKDGLVYKHWPAILQAAVKLAQTEKFGP